MNSLYIFILISILLLIKYKFKYINKCYLLAIIIIILLLNCENIVEGFKYNDEQIKKIKELLDKLSIKINKINDPKIKKEYMIILNKYKLKLLDIINNKNNQNIKNLIKTDKKHDDSLKKLKEQIKQLNIDSKAPTPPTPPTPPKPTPPKPTPPKPTPPKPTPPKPKPPKPKPPKPPPTSSSPCENPKHNEKNSSCVPKLPSEWKKHKDKANFDGINKCKDKNKPCWIPKSNIVKQDNFGSYYNSDRGRCIIRGLWRSQDFNFKDNSIYPGSTKSECEQIIKNGYCIPGSINPSLGLKGQKKETELRNKLRNSKSLFECENIK